MDDLIKTGDFSWTYRGYEIGQAASERGKGSYFTIHPIGDDSFESFSTFTTFAGAMATIDQRTNR